MPVLSSICKPLPVPSARCNKTLWLGFCGEQTTLIICDGPGLNTTINITIFGELLDKSGLVPEILWYSFMFLTQ